MPHPVDSLATTVGSSSTARSQEPGVGLHELSENGKSPNVARTHRRLPRNERVRRGRDRDKARLAGLRDRLAQFSGSSGDTSDDTSPRDEQQIIAALKQQNQDLSARCAALAAQRDSLVAVVSALQSTAHKPSGPLPQLATTPDGLFDVYEYEDDHTSFKEASVNTDISVQHALPDLFFAIGPQGIPTACISGVDLPGDAAAGAATTECSDFNSQHLAFSGELLDDTGSSGGLATTRALSELPGAEAVASAAPGEPTSSDVHQPLHSPYRIGHVAGNTATKQNEPSLAACFGSAGVGSSVTTPNSSTPGSSSPGYSSRAAVDSCAQDGGGCHEHVVAHSTPGFSSPGSSSSAVGHVSYKAPILSSSYCEGCDDNQTALIEHFGTTVVTQQGGPAYDHTVGEGSSRTTPDTLTYSADGHAPAAGVNAVAQATQCGHPPLVADATFSPGGEAVVSPTPGMIGEGTSRTTPVTLTCSEDGHAPAAGVNAVAPATQCGRPPLDADAIISPGGEALVSPAPGMLGEGSSRTTLATLTWSEDGHAPPAGVNAVAHATQCGRPPLVGEGSSRTTPGTHELLPTTAEPTEPASPVLLDANADGSHAHRVKDEHSLKDFAAPAGHVSDEQERSLHAEVLMYQQLVDRLSRELASSDVAAEAIEGLLADSKRFLDKAQSRLKDYISTQRH